MCFCVILNLILVIILNTMVNAVFFQIVKYAQDLFAAFSGVLIRMYLNITLNYSSFLSTNLQDEKRITETIVKHSHFLLSRFGLQVNIYYF